MLFVVYCFVAENEKGEYSGAVSVGAPHYVYIVVPALFIVLIA